MPLEITTLDNAALLLEINNAAVPAVGSLTPAKADWLVAHAALPLLTLLDDRPAGLVVVLSDTCGYDSDYFRWFTDRYTNFLYIDRVVVADWARGQGIARQLYTRIEGEADVSNLAIVSDVYSEPPNVPSLALHRAMGYEEVGAQPFPHIGKTAAKFMKYRERVKAKV
jgi:predicted GNAT superfamily acetyltransferase